MKLVGGGGWITPFTRGIFTLQSIRSTEKASQNPLTSEHRINHEQSSPSASVKTGFRLLAGFCQCRQTGQWLRHRLSEVTPSADTHFTACQMYHPSSATSAFSSSVSSPGKWRLLTVATLSGDCRAAWAACIQRGLWKHTPSSPALRRVRTAKSPVAATGPCSGPTTCRALPW